MIVETVGAATHVRADDAKLTNVEIIEAEFRRDADAPIDGFERRVAVEQIEAETQCLVEEGLLAAAEKTRTARLRLRSHRWAKERGGHRKMFLKKR